MFLSQISRASHRLGDCPRALVRMRSAAIEGMNGYRRFEAFFLSRRK